MKEAIEAAVRVLTQKVTSNTGHDEALKYTQSVLNLTHALATLNSIK